jgi:hypothetical protein
MITIGDDELKGKMYLGEKITCKICGEEHQIEYGDQVLKDGTRLQSKKLAFYKCNGKAYLAGIDGKRI